MRVRNVRDTHLHDVVASTCLKKLRTRQLGELRVLEVKHLLETIRRLHENAKARLIDHTLPAPTNVQYTSTLHRTRFGWRLVRNQCSNDTSSMTGSHSGPSKFHMTLVQNSHAQDLFGERATAAIGTRLVVCVKREEGEM